MVVVGSISLQEHSIRELNDIYDRIKPYIRKTPLIKIESLSAVINGAVWLKPESLQFTGAFKFRGALYRLMTLTDREKKRGVTAYSSGNFALGLATAGRMLDVAVNLVMPADAPENKIVNARQQGATVTLCQHFLPSREEAASQMAMKMARTNGQVLLHPFDDIELIRGQASVAIELQQQLIEEKISCDQILCPVGGGSLVAGTSMVFGSPTLVTAVEAEGYAGMGLSLEQGTLARAKGNITSECDALLALAPGQSNFHIARKNKVNALTTGAPAIQQAMKLAFAELNLVLEPSGAIALGAVIEHPDVFWEKELVVIATGGNVDQSVFLSAISAI